MLGEPSRKGALLDLLLVNREDLTAGHLGHSDRKVVEFNIFGDRRKTDTKTSTLDMRRAVFSLFREQLVRSPGKLLLKVLGSISAGYFLCSTS